MKYARYNKNVFDKFNCPRPRQIGCPPSSYVWYFLIFSSHEQSLQSLTFYGSGISSLPSSLWEGRKYTNPLRKRNETGLRGRRKRGRGWGG